MSREQTSLLIVFLGIVAAVLFYLKYPEIFFLNLANILLIIGALVFFLKVISTKGRKAFINLGVFLIVTENLLELYLRISGSLDKINGVIGILMLSAVPLGILLIIINYKDIKNG